MKNNKKNILIVYATCSGNAELVAQAISDGLLESGDSFKLVQAEITTPSEMNNYDATILVCSTWNVGLLNNNMIKFHKEMVKMQFPNMIIEVVALGDSKNYDIFCGAADLLESAVTKVGARQIMDTLRIDGAVSGRLEEFKEWGREFCTRLGSI